MGIKHVHGSMSNLPERFFIDKCRHTLPKTTGCPLGFGWKAKQIEKSNAGKTPIEDKSKFMERENREGKLIRMIGMSICFQS